MPVAKKKPTRTKKPMAPSQANAAGGSCALCGMSAKLSCSSCAKYNLKTKYCSQSCQKADWKDHKDVCGVKNPKAVAHESVSAGGLAGGWASKLSKPEDRCTRCLCDCNDGVCRVPHPVMDRDMKGMMHEMSGDRAVVETMHCRACDQMYEVSNKKHKSGPRYCYEGPHTKAPLAKGDAKRVQPLTVHITESPRLQRSINAISEDTVCLIITDDSFEYYDDGAWVFEKKLPNLRELRLDGVKFSRLVLNDELTPELRKLRVVNLGHTCDIRVRCPKLKDLTIHYLHPGDGDRDSEQINEALSAATKLERFDSYKLQISDPLEFASNNLESIYIHRSDGLEGLSMWAPNLKTLKLQANYNIGFIDFLEDHPLKKSLPANHAPPKLEVTTINCNLSPEVRQEIADHPTAVMMKDDAGGRDFAGGMAGGAGAMEAMFAQMHSNAAAARGANPGMNGMEAMMQSMMQWNSRNE